MTLVGRVMTLKPIQGATERYYNVNVKALSRTCIKIHVPPLLVLLLLLGFSF